MEQEEITLKRTEESMIYGYIWKPEKKIIGIIHLIHGMTEHMGRYKQFAKKFTNAGYIVCGFDIQGHGKSSKENALYIKSWEGLITDLEYCRKYLKRRYPNTPYYMLGFSLGSFILRHHQCLYPDTADKLIYVGTGYPKLTELKFAEFLVQHLCKHKDKASKLVRKMAFDSYNTKIKNATRENEWLLKDNKSYDEYKNDPLVISNMTPGFFLEFLHGMILVEENEGWLCNHTKTLFIAGEDDPVADLKHHGMQKVEEVYKQAGADVADCIIPKYCHDVLHDRCYQEVFKEIQIFCS